MNIFRNIQRDVAQGQIVLTCPICEKPELKKIEFKLLMPSGAEDKVKICSQCSVELLQAMITLDLTLAVKAATNLNLGKVGIES